MVSKQTEITLTALYVISVDPMLLHPMHLKGTQTMGQPAAGQSAIDLPAIGRPPVGYPPLGCKSLRLLGMYCPSRAFLVALGGAVYLQLPSLSFLPEWAMQARSFQTGAT